MSEIFGSCFLANKYIYIYWFDSILNFSFFLIILPIAQTGTYLQSSAATEAENELLPPRQTTPKWPS